MIMAKRPLGGDPESGHRSCSSSTGVKVVVVVVKVPVVKVVVVVVKVVVLVVKVVVLVVVLVVVVAPEVARAALSPTVSIKATTGGVTTAKRPHCSRNARRSALCALSSCKLSDTTSPPPTYQLFIK